MKSFTFKFATIFLLFFNYIIRICIFCTLSNCVISFLIKPLAASNCDKVCFGLLILYRCELVCDWFIATVFIKTVPLLLNSLNLYVSCKSNLISMININREIHNFEQSAYFGLGFKSNIIKSAWRCIPHKTG